MSRFAPWAGGVATTLEDGRISGTIYLSDKYAGWTIESVESFGDGFVTVVFCPPDYEAQ